MKLVALVHRAAPDHGAGAEWMLHSIFRWLVERGHEATILVTHGRSHDFQGVEVRSARSTRPMTAFEEADVAFTHLDVTRRAIREATRTQTPLVHVVHNDRQLRYFHVKPSEAALVVFNSHWLLRAENWRGPKMVLHPPVFHADYAVEPGGDAVTLINLMRAKGADVFWSLARARPEQRFLGVLGGYGRQELNVDVPPNVEVVSNVADVREIYRQTRVLLMPSSYESWGRCAIEAAVSGIPTVASPTPGLRESLRNAAIFADPRRLSEWTSALTRLANPEVYARLSRLARERAAELDPQEQLEALERRLVQLARR